jgi:UDP-N-acetylmuramoylalanine--D-glutamate ligase
MGLGLLGRGVGDARYLVQCGAELIVTDLKMREELADSVAQLKSFSRITFVLGKHRFEDFCDRDFILKAAGVPMDSPYIAEAKKNNIPIRMSADLFAEISGISVIGVTGTRGKSTVAHMIYAILKVAKKPVVLGGNVRGVSTLALLSEVTFKHIAILELDSWQLQGFREAKISPYIAVFTTFYPDHLNYYKNNLDAYLADKANIFLCQKSEDTLVLGAQAAKLVQREYRSLIHSHTIIAGTENFPSDWRLKIPGEHNRYNAALALAVARALNISDTISRRALESFAGVPGRLEFIAEKNGVKIYNDTTATTPEATIAALNALDVAHTIVIAGGADKNLNLDALIARLKDAERVVLLAGSGTERIKGEFPDAPIFDSLEKAVAAARSAAAPGDNILFSPAFASFGMFKNEFDRGDQFVELVRKLP